MNLGANPPRCGGGLLLRNLLRFARVLRACGLPIGPGRVVSAAEAVRAVGIENREDFYWTLHAVFVHRAADRELFDQAFHVFWRSPGLLDRLGELVLPERGAEALPQRELGRRVAEALAAGRSHLQASPALPSRVEPDAVLTWSPREVLRNKDFEQMSEEEVVQAKAAVAAMRPLLPRVSTRRLRIHPRGRRVDMRATLREALRAGPGSIPLIYSRHGKRPAPIVVICDVSGSMSRYSSLLLHFAHTLCALRERIHAFVFGTRLTNITRHLRERDVDTALQGVSRAVEDWSGGTRIGRCLHEFNRVWSRRVLGPGALVLLVSDGLDRDVGQGLAAEMERLQKSCRRLFWLNPLLRFPGFEPRARGMRAMLPFVHELRSIHNLDSLDALCEALSTALAARKATTRGAGFVSDPSFRVAC